jgi:hypothetical protein
MISREVITTSPYMALGRSFIVALQDKIEVVPLEQ